MAAAMLCSPLSRCWLPESAGIRGREASCMSILIRMMMQLVNGIADRTHVWLFGV
jgi:hypothetical protein